MYNVFKDPEIRFYIVIVSLLLVVSFFISFEFGLLLTVNQLGFLGGYYIGKL